MNSVSEISIKSSSNLVKYHPRPSLKKEKTGKSKKTEPRTEKFAEFTPFCVNIIKYLSV